MTQAEQAVHYREPNADRPVPFRRVLGVLRNRYDIGPKVLRSVTAELARCPTVVAIPLLLAITIVAAIGLAELMCMLVYGDRAPDLKIIVLLTTIGVSLPLIGLSLATIKGLDRSRMRYRMMRDTALRQSRAKTEFLANIGHELRTPLNAILAFSEILGKEMLGPVGQTKYVEYAEDIHASGTHLLEIIDELLLHTAIEVGGRELREEAIDLGACVGQAMRMLRPRARQLGLVLTAEIEPAGAIIRGEERLVRQMLLNLLSNAIKFTPAGGSVAIRTRPERGRDYIIAVTDTGIGIAPPRYPEGARAIRPNRRCPDTVARRDRSRLAAGALDDRDAWRSVRSCQRAWIRHDGVPVVSDRAPRRSHQRIGLGDPRSLPS